MDIKVRDSDQEGMKAYYWTGFNVGFITSFSLFVIGFAAYFVAVILN